MSCTRTRHVFISDSLTEPDGKLPPETVCQCGRYQWGQLQIARDAQIRAQALEEANRAIADRGQLLRSQHKGGTHLPIANGLDYASEIIRKLIEQEPDHD